MQDKRQQLIGTALTLFYQSGIHAVGINDVLKQSGIAKKTLYHHFPSKEALVLATLEYRHQRFVAWLDARLNGHSTNLEICTALFTALDDWFHNRVAELMPFQGCYFINTAAHCGESAAPISQYCAQHKQSVIALVAQKLHAPAPSLLDKLSVLIEGCISMAYVNQQPNAAQFGLAILADLPELK